MQRIVVRQMVDARARELTNGTHYPDADFVLARVFPDYEPVTLPAPEPGAWMPHAQRPPIWFALRVRHAGGK